MPFTATFSKIKATAVLFGNSSEYAANPTANDTAAHGSEAKCTIASAQEKPHMVEQKFRIGDGQADTIDGKDQKSGDLGKNPSNS